MEPPAPPLPDLALASPLPLDPLTEQGALELRRRIVEATPRRVPRAELDGHVGLSSAELYELGATVDPVGLRGAPSAVVGRLQILVGAAVGTFALALALRPTLEPLFGLLSDALRDPEDEGAEAGLALAAFFLVCGLGCLAVVERGVRRVRRGIAARRRSTAGAATSPADDPQARPTVAVVQEPHALRVSLLWLRGDVDDASLLEVRPLLEERVPADEPGRAEDVVEQFAEVALRAESGRTLPWGRRAGGGATGTGATASSARADGAAGADGDVRPTRRRDRALVRAARSDLPAVDPRQPVDRHWDPEPLTDEGRAEIAARLVRARPLLWSPAALERVAVDPEAPLQHRPPDWPADHVRRAPLAPPLSRTRRFWLGSALWLSAATWFVALGSIDTADDPSGHRVVGYTALAIVAGLVLARRTIASRAPGRRVLRAVHEAARTPTTALERGVPGAGGRVLVLHGRRGGVDRLELVHARAAPGDGDKQRLEVRTLAWRTLRPDDAEDPRAAAQDLWRIADDAGFVTLRRQADAGTVQRLNTALGRAVERRRALRLRREPLAWVAVGWAVMFGVLALGAATSDDAFDEGAALVVAMLTWPLLAAGVVWRAARRVRDPVGDED